MSTTLSNAKSKAVTSSSARFTDALEAGKTYEISGDVDFWFKLSGDGETLVAAEDGAIHVYAGTYRVVTPKNGAYLFIIRAAVDGTVNVVEVETY